LFCQKNSPAAQFLHLNIRKYLFLLIFMPESYIHEKLFYIFAPLNEISGYAHAQEQQAKELKKLT